MEMTKRNIILRLEILERAIKKLGVEIDLSDRKKEIYHLSIFFQDQSTTITELSKARKEKRIISAFDDIRSEIRAELLIRKQRHNFPKI